MLSFLKKLLVGPCLQVNQVLPVRCQVCQSMLIVLTLIATSTATASAQIIDWSNTSSNSTSFYGIGSNWSGGTAPNGSQTARFNLASSYEVWWDALTESSNPDVGSVQVQNGGVVRFINQTSATRNFTVNGTFDVSGPGTSFFNEGVNLTVNGLVNVQNDSGMRLDGAMSQLNTGVFDLSGNLAVLNGAQVHSTAGGMGVLSGAASPQVFIRNDGSSWHTGVVLNVNRGVLNIEDGGTVFQGALASEAIGGTALYINQVLTVSGGSIINNEGRSYVGLSAGTDARALVNGGSTLNSDSILAVGFGVKGTLEIEGGSKVNNTLGSLGFLNGSEGIATVVGTGSEWNNSENLTLGVTNLSRGALTLSDGGVVSVGDGTNSVAGTVLLVGDSGSNGNLSIQNRSVITNDGSSLIGHNAGSTGSVSISDSGSLLNTREMYLGGTSAQDGGVGNVTLAGSSQLNIGSDAGTFFPGTKVSGNGSDPNGGDGVLWIRNGSSINGGVGILGISQGKAGFVTVTGNNSQWNPIEMLIGIEGNAVVDILDGGRITTGDASLGIGSNSTSSVLKVSGTNSTFSASNLSLGTSGAGTLIVESGGDVTTATSSVADQNGSDGLATVSGMSSSWNNSGDLFLGGNSTTMGGDGSIEISDSGHVTVGGQMKVWSSGIVEITGAELFADGGLQNEGQVILKGGSVHGEVVIRTSGSIAIEEGTAFFDDVVHNGTEIRIAESSGLVFLGDYSGAGSFTGRGDVFFEGDLRPGNSPATVTFEGNVFLESSAVSFFEIGGTGLNTFDRLEIEGDLSLAGMLDVSMIDGFTLDLNQEFLIADIMGTRNGFFQGLGEGDLVGNFGGHDLFISYSAGNGNDISLFTSVPEPGSAAVIGLLSVGVFVRRRRIV